MRDAAEKSATVRRAYEDFLSGVRPTVSAVRTLVYESWARSVDRGVNPSAIVLPGDAASAMDPSDFESYRASHPMSTARPLIASLLLDDVCDSGSLIAFTDQLGRLLWIDGSAQARRRASGINFVEGAVWSEDIVGTTAPGLALHMDKSVRITGPEHFSDPVKDWNCAAAPIHDPVTGGLIGVIDVAGGDAVASPFALATVRSSVAAVEHELRSRAADLSEPAIFADPPSAELRVLHGSVYAWRRDAPYRSERTLSRRHAEILVLLQAFPEGLSTDQLALLLAENGIDPVTVRAEMSRLRRELGGDVVRSRPYGLAIDLRSDVAEVRADLARGAVLTAIEQLGRGGLLAESHAPGVVDLFDDVREEIRSRVIASGELSALRAWTTSAHGRDDVLAWQRLGRALAPHDPERAAVQGRLRAIHRRLGA